MGVNQFYRASNRLGLDEVVRLTGAKIDDGAKKDIAFDGAGPIDEAGPGALAFMDNSRYAAGLGSTRAGGCFVQERFAHRLPATTIALVVSEPYRAFAIVLGRMFPDALRPTSMFGTIGVSPGAFIHPEARLEAGVTVDPGVVIGPRAEIGSGTVIGPNAVIGPEVRIGRDCAIGANTTIMAALVGNRVILHGGVRIGQDGFGFAMSGRGHLKVPQIGRVIIQDDVEVGANTTIDRGSVKDTIIGEGAKIDNLVQIGHNVIIGRHCILVSQTGISGSTKLGDFAVTGGQAGLAGHLTVGAGAQLAAKAGLAKDVPAGEVWGGFPARRLKDWLRQEAFVRELARDATGKAAPRKSKS